jgi:hypothetical protein
MQKHFGDKVAAELQARARDHDTFERIFQALDSYPARARDRHQVIRMPGRATARLSYNDADVCAFYVRKGRIVVHPRSLDLEVLPDVEAAVDRMAVLLAHAILEHGEHGGEEAVADGAAAAAGAVADGAAAAAGAHLIKLADGRRA